MESFIYLNGSELKAERMDKYFTFIALADGSLSEDELAEWIRRNLSPR